jgi:hypothetical protein
VLTVVLGAAAALRLARAIPWPLFGVGALYAATAHGPLDGWSLAVGVALLLAAELAYAAVDVDARLRQEPELARRSAAAVASVVVAAVAAGFAVVLAAGVEIGAGLPLATAGAVAAAGLLLLVLRLATSSSPSS